MYVCVCGGKQRVESLGIDVKPWHYSEKFVAMVLMALVSGSAQLGGFMFPSPLTPNARCALSKAHFTASPVGVSLEEERGIKRCKAGKSRVT